MTALHRVSSGSSVRSWLEGLPRWLFAPVPLVLLQPILGHIATHVATTRPELFTRLGPHARRRFLIDPVDLPFVLVLRPDPIAPRLKAHRRDESPAHDACVAGTFLDLFDMIDGSLDGDALFFTRDLRITGDVEAVVALRNALDDFNGSVVETILSGLGPFSRPAKQVLVALHTIRRVSRHAG